MSDIVNGKCNGCGATGLVACVKCGGAIAECKNRCNSCQYHHPQSEADLRQAVPMTQENRKTASHIWRGRIRGDAGAWTRLRPNPKPEPGGFCYRHQSYSCFVLHGVKA